MTFEVEVAGRMRTVTVEPADQSGRLRVTLDGEPHVLDVARAGEYGLSLLVQPPDGTVPFSGRARVGKRTAALSAEVQITPGAVAGEVLAHLHGRTIAVTINNRRARHAADAGAHGHGESSVVAPMPGRVVRVRVSPGEDVSARQGVVVVEAMKMENELRAPRAGRVKEVTVAPGTSVEAGHVLAVIE